MGEQRGAGGRGGKREVSPLRNGEKTTLILYFSNDNDKHPSSGTALCLDP